LGWKLNGENCVGPTSTRRDGSLNLVPADAFQGPSIDQLALEGALPMDFEKFTERARGFVQSAQSLALREGHQQFTPEHLLKVLLDDPEGLAGGLIDRSGGRSRDALAATELALGKRPKVSGGGAGQLYLDPALARVIDAAEKAGEK